MLSLWAGMAAPGTGARFMVGATRCHTMVLSVAAAASMVASASVRADGEGLATFRMEYPKALETQKQSYGRAEVIATGVRIDGRTGEPRATTRYVVTVDGDLKKVVQTNRVVNAEGDENATTFVAVLSESYIFELWKSKETDNQYIIKYMRQMGGPGAESDIRLKEGEFRERAGRFVWATFSNNQFSMEDIFDEKKYRLISGRFVNDRGVRVYRLRFENAKGAYRTLSGEVELLPDRCWAVRSMALDIEAPVKAPHLPPGAKFKTEVASAVEYGEDRNGVPIPIRVEYTKGRSQGSFTIDSVTLRKSADSGEFTLSHFGLPDTVVTSPPGDPSRGYAVYWFVLVAILAFASAVAILYNRKAGPQGT